ncbi:TetR/AcrR family transcriptional regulator [Streptomyces sp. NBC_00199]|uniref:TetR/AcrR family transcriptional regulator n=1 Tax=Streptomyces sp. NBC_00199 TaxID=2975678 RepID=UPI002255B2C6|nr:TetR/AcrR family transcriptional regulator [Streptomyces sp. NBC_00199]MCX5265810.1 TetR/AcrR family transcriptional regulator [Streptomyces sp. NBC_00199]
MDPKSPRQQQPRGRNPRGQGERLREDVLAATLRTLDELGDDQALSLRAVAREIHVAATSVYLHFPDRDALVLAALERCHQDLMLAVRQAELAEDGPVAQLRARTLVLGAWAHDHPGLYKVLHESTLNQRTDMRFKEGFGRTTTAAVRRCMDAGLAPMDNASTVTLDARAFGTSCIHEHACVRCSMLLPEPDQRGHLVEIRDNLLARIIEAEREG